jgi:hypothetical protein
MKNESKQQPWFDVDRAGLRKILEARGLEFAVFELIQNAWDEAGVTRVDVTLKPASNGYATLTVSDDAPEGFKDLRHAYTLFAESAKKANPQQRGRFNIGEKLVLALCKYAGIMTTKGNVIFGDDGTRVEGRNCTKVGSVFEGRIKMSGKDIERITREVQKLLPPANITTMFNGEEIKSRDCEREVDAILATIVAEQDGVLRHTRRKTTIKCYVPRDGETAMIYEMGIPVVEHDCAFHCDVQQKVPLTLDRSNVSERFLRALRIAVFNETHTLLSTEEVNHEWAQTAIESPDAKPAAVADYMTKRFGEKRVSFDMSDREANNRAVANDYTVVHGSMLSKAAWHSVKEHETIQPAGQVFPTKPDNVIGHESVEPDDHMQAVADYARELAELLLGCSITVQFGEQSSCEAASWCNRTLQFNITNLGRGWFDLEHNRESILDLILHEFGHHYEANHLSAKYNDALSRLGAKGILLAQQGRLP